MGEAAESLLSRVAAGIATTRAAASSHTVQRSILSQAAEAYARKPSEAESTMQTGFDPQAASLFEAVIEASFLVANADGVFDDSERDTFETVVVQACKNSVQRAEVSALVADLREQLDEDGQQRRIARVALVVHNREHKLEVLRIAALMAHISGGVADSERALLDQLASGFELTPQDVTSALEQARAALAS